MTLLTGGREPGMRDWCSRGGVVVLVTTDAGRCGDVVVVVDVTVGALPRRHQVRSRQNEPRSRMVKLAIGPRHRVMTLLAGGREAGVRNRSGRRVVVVLVTTDAGRDGDAVIVVDVAIGALAGRHHVRSSQREA